MWWRVENRIAFDGDGGGGGAGGGNNNGPNTAGSDAGGAVGSGGGPGPGSSPGGNTANTGSPGTAAQGNSVGNNAGNDAGPDPAEPVNDGDSQRRREQQQRSYNGDNGGGGGGDGDRQQAQAAEAVKQMIRAQLLRQASPMSSGQSSMGVNIGGNQIGYAGGQYFVLPGGQTEFEAGSRGTIGFDQVLDSVVQNAQQRAFNQARTRGLSNQYDDYLTEQIGGLRGSVGPGTVDFSSTFDRGIGDRLLDTLQTQRRGEYTSAVNERLPVGFTDERIPDTLDDQAIERIFSERYNPAEDFVERARDRRQLNDQGFNRAMEGLRSASDTARSRLGELGRNLLTDYRTEAKSMADMLREQAGSYKLGSGFRPDAGIGRVESRIGEFGEQATGDLRRNLGEEKLFNPQELFSQAGSQQGFINPGRNALLDSFSRRNESRFAQRGLGSSGAF